MASLVDGVQSDNINIKNATDVLVFTVNGTTFLFSELIRDSTVSRRALLTMDDQAQLQTNKRVLQEQDVFGGILVNYTITFNAQDVLIVSADPQQAFNKVSEDLQTAASSKGFDAALQSTAQRLEIRQLGRLSTVSRGLSIRQVFTASIVHSALPTSQPSAQPTSFPSSTPTLQPTACPSSLPSSQPSSTPTTIPTSAPTFQIETKWMNNVGDAFERTIGNDKDDGHPTLTCAWRLSSCTAAALSGTTTYSAVSQPLLRRRISRK